MYTKSFSIINLLADASAEYVTSLQLAKQLGTSTRMVLRYIKEARENSLEYGYKIHSFKGRGYQLEICDEKRFEMFCCSNGENAENLQDEDLIRKTVKYIMLYGSCKLDELAELFNYSRSSMSRITISANSYLESFGLQLVSKAYTGLYIQGNEISIRDCMYHLYRREGQVSPLFTQPAQMEIDMSEVREWMEYCFRQEGIAPGTAEKQQFLVYLMITIKRIGLDKAIGFGYLANIDELPQFRSQLDRTLNLLKRYDPVSDLYGESAYLTLIWMQTFKRNNQLSQLGEYDMMFFHNLIRKAMGKIEDNYGVNLSGDEILVNGLILHVASSYGKYLLHMESENPFYEELQKKYPTAYYYSIELAECIAEYTNLNLPCSELGFLTIYFASSLERTSGGYRRKTVILGENTRGSSQLLKSLIEKTYKTIEVIGVYSYETPDLIPQEVDFYSSIVPDSPKQLYGHEVLFLSPFLNESDQQQIRQMLKRLRAGASILEICKKDCFFIWDKVEKKKTLLHYLCKTLRESGHMTEMDEDAVLARENLVSTEIASNVAMPHCLIEGNSFMSFVVLKNPIMWGRARVRLVILGCFHRGDVQIKEILEWLFRLVSDEKNVNRLADCHTYEEFMTCIKEFDGGDLC